MPNIMNPLIFTIILLIRFPNPVRSDPDTFLEFLDSIGNVPWLVSLSQGHFCDGSLVTTWWVLTAAHCVRNFDHFGLELNVDVVKLVGQNERYAITGQQCVGSGIDAG